MKISFVATVFNEEKTVTALLDSIFKQTRLPDEVVIVDGGSRDLTVAKIKNEKLKMKNDNEKLKIFIKPKSTIAQGRNYGIEKATGDIIVMSDAGCVLQRDWLEKITEPFIKENADIVAGFYRMIGSTPLQKALSVFLGIPRERFDQNKFLPSARSIAFKKTLWKKIGGFNEKLERAGEDTQFNYEALKLGAKFVRVKDALVDWEVPKNLWEGLRKFYIYAKGDVQAGIWWHPTQRISTHNLKIFSVFVRYAVGIMLFALAFKYEILGFILALFILAYFVYPIWKMRDVVTDFRARLWLPIMQIGSDIAVVAGTSRGLLKSLA